MVLVAGSVFLACRCAAGAGPAAGAALAGQASWRPSSRCAAAGFYMLLAGATRADPALVPDDRRRPRRRCIVDRNPFSLRLLAWAALVVLLLRPESRARRLVPALLRRRAGADRGLRGLGRAARRGRCARAAACRPLPSRYSPASRPRRSSPAPPPHRSPPSTSRPSPTYGVLANLLAVPLTSFLVMPAGMLGLLLMPLGLDGPAFRLMAWASRPCSDRPARGRRCPAPRSPWRSGRRRRLALARGRRALARLWRRPWRWLGLAACAAACCSSCCAARPTSLVDPQPRHRRAPPRRRPGPPPRVGPRRPPARDLAACAGRPEVAPGPSAAARRTGSPATPGLPRPARRRHA